MKFQASRRRHGEGRPDQHHPGQHLARAVAVGPPGGGHAEGGIGDREGAEDIAHLNARQSQFGADLGREDRDTDPVEIGDRGQRHGERNDPIANCELHATLMTKLGNAAHKPPEFSLNPRKPIIFYLAGSIVDLFWKIQVLRTRAQAAA